MEYSRFSQVHSTEVAISDRTEKLLKMIYNFKQPNRNRFNSGLFLNSIQFPCLDCSDVHEMMNWIYELHDNGYINMFGRTFEDAEFTLKGMQVIDNLGKEPTNASKEKTIIIIQNAEEDILDFKPNIGGLGINFNAAWKRFKKFLQHQR